MNVLIACEFSGIVREAFKSKGHNAWSCDLLPTEIDGQHYEGNVEPFMYQHDWDLIIAHPPCTYLTNSGVRWFWDENGLKNEERWCELLKAIDFFNSFKGLSEKFCIENPIPHKYAKYGTRGSNGIGNYSQLIQPYQFGHTTSKATCLWLYGLPKLVPTNIIPKEDRTFDIHRMPPGPDRQKDRSRTFQGIADAMADQWG